MTNRAPHPDVVPPPGGLCWRRSARRRYGSGPEAHAELVVLLGLRGEAQYLLDGRVYGVQQGTLLWAFAGQAHVLLSDSADFDMWVFLISARVHGGSEEGLPPLTVSEAGAATPRVVSGAATHALSTLAAEVQAAPAPDVRATGLRWWLARAWAYWHDAEDSASRSVHPAVGWAARLIRDDPAQSLAAVARASGLSPGRLSAVFKRETGQSLVEYRSEQRLGRVEAAMAAGERSLTRAALEAGFGSYTQFYRAHVARRGTGPRAALKPSGLTGV
ncbi:MAG: AraC family transcriptional regulator [Pseudomonadota bacterium]